MRGGPQYTFENPLQDEDLDNVYVEKKEHKVEEEFSYGGGDYGRENDYYPEVTSEISSVISKKRKVSQSSTKDTESVTTAEDRKSFEGGKQQNGNEKVEVGLEDGDDQMFINEISNLNYA